MTLSLHFLETFSKIVEFGSFSRTAQVLNISQSAISQQIEVLEKYFDAKLFERTIRGVKLTEEGRILLKHAKSILGSIKIAQMEINQSLGEIRGTIKISSSTIPGEHILPKLIITFKQKNPNVNFEVEVNDSEISILKLADHNVDLAAVGSLGELKELDTIVLAEEELILAIPVDHVLAQKSTADLKDILRYPYISREKTSGTRKESERILKKEGLSLDELQVIGELNTTESVLTAISEGLGISLISSIAASKMERSGLIKCLKLPKTVSSKRSLYLVKRKVGDERENRVLDTFWKFVKSSYN